MINVADYLVKSGSWTITILYTKESIIYADCVTWNILQIIKNDYRAPEKETWRYCWRKCQLGSSSKIYSKAVKLRCWTVNSNKCTLNSTEQRSFDFACVNFGWFIRGIGKRQNIQKVAELRIISAVRDLEIEKYFPGLKVRFPFCCDSLTVTSFFA